MAGKKRGLGRGLDALLGAASSPPVQTATSGEEVPLPEPDAHPQGDHLRMLPVDVIHKSRYQPRHDFPEDTLQELADSIRAQGVVQPIVVRPHASKAGHFELIAGERRWRASQLAGLHDIPAVVRDVPDQAAMAMGLIENIQREELNPIEEAMALQRLIGEFGLTHQETAEAVGRSRASVSNLLRLLSLEPAVKELLEAEDLEMGHARALLALQGQVQIEAARKVVQRGLSVRETESLVRKLQQPAKPKTSGQKADPDLRRFEEEMSEKLGAPVQIQYDNKGKGKLVIRYNSLDELEGILEHIK